MSHYTRDYANQTDRKAIIDWVNWLGMKRAKILLRVARQDQPIADLWKSFNFYCSFTGVSGYPVLATFAYCHAMTVEELRNHPALQNID